MQNGEIIPMLIARIKQNNTDNMVIRSKLYSLLTDITNKFDEVIRAVPRIEDFQNMSNVDGTILETKSKYPINTFENESSKEVSK